ncbi:MAG TPA: family 20 glycosylhydrolase [Cyclobacteriaceae bacterium]|nr:family 20 glycosylhydrolase [Cyclobacteriaceae bacterium]
MRPHIIILFAILFFSSCNKGKQKFSSVENLAVKWELVSNFTGEKDVFNARFLLTNNGEQALHENWALFFNMAPRPILENKTPQGGTLHHINGDWYKLVPVEEFILEPGKTIAINYRGTEAVIKETDRPLGLYIVFYKGNGDEESIAEITDYTWSEFSVAEQVNRNEEDVVPIPTPDWNYKSNLKLHELGEGGLLSIIPTPLKTKKGSGRFEINAQTKIFCQAGLENEATYLTASLKEVMGKEIEITKEKPSANFIQLQKNDVRVNGISREAYQLNVTNQGVVITGNDAAGVFYGIQSLRALIPLESYEKQTPALPLPVISIEDAPRFGFRGLHLDVSRNFQTKESILRLLDLLSFYKLNRFLFYITEDEGWRLEIKDLPELTEIGAQRHHTLNKEDAVLHPAYGSGPFAKQEGTYGYGYYTREDFIEILKYANARHIKVIPEVNFPGHARAAIKAMEARYNRFMKEGKEEEANEYRLVDPDDKSEYLSAQGYKDNVVCIARESAFHFYEKVVNDIEDMYKEAGLTIDEFHTGGDEVPEGAWTKSPMAIELMRKHSEIKDPKNLQAYFFGELVKRLKKKNFQIHGWEEVSLTKNSEGKYIPNLQFAHEDVVPYIWNNLFDPELAYRLANAGYKIVLCNVSNFYFDLAYNKDPREPGLYWAGFVNERNAWAFAPFDLTKTTTKNSLGQDLNLTYSNTPGTEVNGGTIEPLRPDARKNILGVEAQLWSETVKGRDMMEYYVLPKLMGFSESAWAPERRWEIIESKDERERLMDQEWNVFANTIGQKELPRLHYINEGYNYRVPSPGAIIEDGLLKANVEYPGLEIRYTLDGQEPTRESLLYTSPVPVKSAVSLRCFDRAGKPSRVVSLNAPTVE